MIELKLPDMSCGHCVRTITETAQDLDAGASVEADLATRTVRIETTADPAALTHALTEAGYPPAAANA